MKSIGLKVDIDTFRGTVEGIPRLIELFKKHNVGATFYFSLGPDQTGRALKRVFRPGFFKKVSRTSVVKHYGIKTLLYGTVLPSPHIGKKCGELMRSVNENGFEVGIHTFNHIKWQDYVVKKDLNWTKNEMESAYHSFIDVFKFSAKTHAAAGWQMNSFAYKLEENMQFNYCSDVRGSHPFIPVVDNRVINCCQIPTTLPTLDELIGVDGLDEKNVANHVLKLTLNSKNSIEVYTLHAELEGMMLLPIMEELIINWKKNGCKIVSLSDLYKEIDLKKLPFHHVIMGEVSGRSGLVASQGELFSK